MADTPHPNPTEVLQELELRFGSCFDDSNRCYDSMPDVGEWCDCCLFEKFKGEAAILVPAPQQLKAVSERRSLDGDRHRGPEGSPQHFSVSGGEALATNTTPGGDTDHPPLSGSEPDASLPLVPAPPEPPIEEVVTKRCSTCDCSWTGQNTPDICPECGATCAVEPDETCRYCGEDIRFRDGAWEDCETHTSCAHGVNVDKRHSPKPEQCEDVDLVSEITEVVRAADREFQRVGGSSRHWVRECFLPELTAACYSIVPAATEEQLRAAAARSHSEKETTHAPCRCGHAQQFHASYSSSCDKCFCNNFDAVDPTSGLAAARSPTPDAQAWQPIETIFDLERDCSNCVVLLFSPREGIIQAFINGPRLAFLKQFIPAEQQNGTRAAYWATPFDATHWMPLPSPPADREETDTP